MPFDQAAFQQNLEDYLNDYVTLEIVNYTGDVNPIGGANQGVNIDVGEVNSFDLKIANDGDLGLLNVAVDIFAQRGRISGSFSGFAWLAGSQWMDPWDTSWQFNWFMNRML